MAVGRARGRRALLAAAAVAALGVALYWPVLDHAWLNYDDDVYLTRNPDLQLGLSADGIRWAFTTFHGANWFPLTWLSWLLDYELHGLEPAGYHAGNLALHAATGALLALALARLTGATGRSAFVAAVFVAHPLHLESVAWAAARKDPLSGLFFALALLAYAPPRGGAPGRGRLAGALACLALGLMAKPTLVTLPGVLLLLDYWPLRRLGDGRIDTARLRRAALEKLPLFALVAVFCGVVFVAQSAGGSVASLEQLSWRARLMNAPVAYCGYLAKAFWPAGLAVIYPHRGEAIAAGEVAAASVALALATGLALAAARRAPALIVGWLWFLGMLVPVIGLVQVGSQALADRYAYLPLVGLSIAVTWPAADALGRAGRRAPALAAALVLAALAASSAVQLRHWRDSTALFEHAIAVTEDNHIAHAHLARARLASGRTREAIAEFSEAVRLRPDYLEAVNNLAWLLATSDDDELRNPYLALRLAERAALLTGRLDPAVLDTLAAAQAASGRFPRAAATAREALELEATRSDPELRAQILDRLAGYEARESVREPAPAPPAPPQPEPRGEAGPPRRGGP